MAGGTAASSTGISKERALMAVPLDIRPNELVPGRPVRLFGGRAGEEVLALRT